MASRADLNAVLDEVRVGVDAVVTEVLAAFARIEAQIPVSGDDFQAEVDVVNGVKAKVADLIAQAQAKFPAA